MIRHAPLDRVDSYMIAALAGATGVDRVIRAAAEAADPESLARVAIRFVEVPLISWGFHGSPVYLTPTDAIALATAAIVLVRFLAWLLSPLFSFAFKRSRNADSAPD